MTVVFLAEEVPSSLRRTRVLGKAGRCWARHEDRSGFLFLELCQRAKRPSFRFRWAFFLCPFFQVLALLGRPGLGRDSSPSKIVLIGGVGTPGSSGGMLASRIEETI